jgi:threonine dehydrogenase-like Zn-dependent dehydrogenase
MARTPARTPLSPPAKTPPCCSRPPDEEDYLPYATLEVAAISLRGRIAADPKPGESCIVIGQGMIGVFSALLFHEAGCRVVVADIDKRRLAFGRGRGYATADLSEPDAEDRIVRLGDDGYDIVVEASGSIPGVELAFRLPRCKPPVSRHEFQVKPIHFYSHNWPRIVMQANYLEKVSIDPWDFMEGQGVTILTPFDRGFDERQKMVDLIQRGAVKMDEFVSVVHKPADMVAGYRSLQNREISALVGDWRPVGR